MIVTCDGTDANLTQAIPSTQFDPSTDTISPWNKIALPGELVINCRCGMTFDDADRRRVYPHPPVRPVT